MEEFRAAQHPSGYPLRLLTGLKKLRNYNDPELMKSFATILGPLMQGTDGQVVDYLKRKDYPSSISLNILTVNHGNLTRSPKLDSKELKSWPIKHRPLIMQMMQNSALILCINELSEVGNTPESNCWHVTFQRIQHLECSDVSSGSKTVAMIRTMIFQHPTVWHPPEHPCSSTRRSILDRDCRHAPPYNGMARTARLSSSTLSRTMRFVEHFQNPLRTLFSPTTPAMSQELTFPLPPLEFSILIRTSAMVQQKTTYRKASCRSSLSTTAMRSQATPTSPQIRSVSYNPSTILSTAL